jgi:hypothetical protein
MIKHYVVPKGDLCDASPWAAGYTDLAHVVLASDYDALAGRIREREAALLKYGHHLAECDYIVDMLPCSCGMEGIRAAIASQDREGEHG